MYGFKPKTSMTVLNLSLIALAGLSCRARAPTSYGAVQPGAGDGAPQCHEDNGADNPYLVEWPTDVKKRIEASSYRGVLLVKYQTCTGERTSASMEVLYGCELQGNYEDIGVTIAKSNDEIKSHDDLYAKLKLGAVNLAAELKQGDIWSIDYVLTNMRETRLTEVSRSMLTGRCAEATHYVASMTLGAYRLRRSAHRSGDGKVEVFHQGGGAGSGGEASSLRADGLYDECASREISSSDQACKAIIRVFLNPITDEAPAAAPPVPVPETVSDTGKPSKKGSTLDTLLEEGAKTEGPAEPAPELGTNAYKAKLEEQWAVVKKAARSRDTEGRLALYQAFLSEYPVDNPYSKTARKQIDEWEKSLEKALAAKENADTAASKREVAKARQDEIRKANESAENASGAAAEKLAAWERFVEAYPENDNPYLGTAERKIKSMKAYLKREQADEARGAAEAARKAEADRQAREAEYAAKRAEEERRKKAATNEKEVKQPNANLYWLRCAVGQTWNGSSCAGDKKAMSWESAKEACPSGYRLPTRQDFVDLLGGCNSAVLDGGYGSCKKCAESSNCSTMFPSDADWYWSSSAGDVDLAWGAGFGYGLVHRGLVSYDYDVRCVRSGP